jgi:hypothetical protein
MLANRLLAAVAVLALLALPATADPGRRDHGGGHGGVAAGGGGHRGLGGGFGSSHPGGGHPGFGRGNLGFGGHVAPYGWGGGIPRAGVPRSGHFVGPGGGWVTQPAWRGAGRFTHWRGGHWWRGNYQGRLGTWWVVGSDWYWYPPETTTARIPDPDTPPGMTAGFWYWCDSAQQYYPYVGGCPEGWRQVAPQQPPS